MQHTLNGLPNLLDHGDFFFDKEYGTTEYILVNSGLDIKADSQR